MGKAKKVTQTLKSQFCKILAFEIPGKLLLGKGHPFPTTWQHPQLAQSPGPSELGPERDKFTFRLLTSELRTNLFSLGG